MCKRLACPWRTAGVGGVGVLLRRHQYTRNLFSQAESAQPFPHTNTLPMRQRLHLQQVPSSKSRKQPQNHLRKRRVSNSQIASQLHLAGIHITVGESHAHGDLYNASLPRVTAAGKAVIVLGDAAEVCSNACANHQVVIAQYESKCSCYSSSVYPESGFLSSNKAEGESYSKPKLPKTKIW